MIVTQSKESSLIYEKFHAIVEKPSENNRISKIFELKFVHIVNSRHVSLEICANNPVTNCLVRSPTRPETFCLLCTSFRRIPDFPRAAQNVCCMVDCLAVPAARIVCVCVRVVAAIFQRSKLESILLAVRLVLNYVLHTAFDLTLLAKRLRARLTCPLLFSASWQPSRMCGRARSRLRLSRVRAAVRGAEIKNGEAFEKSVVRVRTISTNFWRHCQTMGIIRNTTLLRMTKCRSWSRANPQARTTKRRSSSWVCG